MDLSAMGNAIVMTLQISHTWQACRVQTREEMHSRTTGQLLQADDIAHPDVREAESLLSCLSCRFTF